MTSDQFYEIRADLKMSQGDFGALLGLHRQTVSKIERGDAAVPYFQAELLEFIKGRRAANWPVGPGQLVILLVRAQARHLQPAN